MFDPDTKDHVRKLKEMDPINFETVSLQKLLSLMIYLKSGWTVILQFVFLFFFCLPGELSLKLSMSEIYLWEVLGHHIQFREFVSFNERKLKYNPGGFKS